MACGRWGHVFATSANPRSCKIEVAMSPSSDLLFVGENMIPECLTIEYIVRAAYGREIISSARVNHETETREIGPTCLEA